jgi:hypothetical protein
MQQRPSVSEECTSTRCAVALVKTIQLDQDFRHNAMAALSHCTQFFSTFFSTFVSADAAKDYMGAKLRTWLGGMASCSAPHLVDLAEVSAM